MKLKEFAREYLTFSRKERIAISAILCLILISILIPILFSSKTFSSHDVKADSAWIAAIKRLEIKEKNDTRDSNRVESSHSTRIDHSTNDRPIPITLFYFDPNTIDASAWEKLGLKLKTIHTVQNYLSKGGHFFKATDLKKIYGFPASDYDRLEPYIKIAATDKPVEFVKKEYEPKHFSLTPIDINTGDTTAFIALPGVGAKLAARIVNFRDRLGGFYSIDQVSETYGLPDSTFQKIKQYLKLETTLTKKISINTATVDELKSHPYIRYNIANSIIAYRKEHGMFVKLEDIKKVMAVTDEVYNKIAPYLELQ